MFQALLDRIHHDIVHSIYNVVLSSNTPSAAANVPRAQTSAMAAASGRQREAVGVGARKVGRNEACPCGSGKKYKRCHGAA